LAPKRSKGRPILVILLIVAGIAAAAIMLWPSKGNTTDKGTAAAAPSATATQPSPTQLYFNGISKAIKAGDLQQQAQYVAFGPDGKFRADFIRHGVPMFPAGTTVTFRADTLVTDSPNTGGVKATSTTTDKNGAVVKTTYTVLLVKEKDSAGNAVWHISDTEEVKG